MPRKRKRRAAVTTDSVATPKAKVKRRRIAEHVNKEVITFESIVKKIDHLIGEQSYDTRAVLRPFVDGIEVLDALIVSYIQRINPLRVPRLSWIAEKGELTEDTMENIHRSKISAIPFMGIDDKWAYCCSEEEYDTPPLVRVCCMYSYALGVDNCF